MKIGNVIKMENDNKNTPENRIQKFCPYCGKKLTQYSMDYIAENIALYDGYGCKTCQYIIREIIKRKVSKFTQHLINKCTNKNYDIKNFMKWFHNGIDSEHTLRMNLLTFFPEIKIITSKKNKNLSCFKNKHYIFI